MLEFVASASTACLCMAHLRLASKYLRSNRLASRLSLLLLSLMSTLILWGFILRVDLFSSYVLLDERLMQLGLGAVSGSVGLDWLIYAQPQSTIRSTHDRIFHDLWALVVFVPIASSLLLSVGIYPKLDNITRGGRPEVRTRSPATIGEYSSAPRGTTDHTTEAIIYAQTVSATMMRDKEYLALLTPINDLGKYVEMVEQESRFFEKYYDPMLACLVTLAGSGSFTKEMFDHMMLFANSIFRLQRVASISQSDLTLALSALAIFQDSIWHTSDSLSSGSGCEGVPKHTDHDMSFHKELPYHALLASSLLVASGEPGRARLLLEDWEDRAVGVPAWLRTRIKFSLDVISEFQESAAITGAAILATLNDLEQILERSGAFGVTGQDQDVCAILKKREDLRRIVLGYLSQTIRYAWYSAKLREVDTRAVRLVDWHAKLDLSCLSLSSLDLHVWKRDVFAARGYVYVRLAEQKLRQGQKYGEARLLAETALGDLEKALEATVELWTPEEDDEFAREILEVLREAHYLLRKAGQRIM